MKSATPGQTARKYITYSFRERHPLFDSSDIRILSLHGEGLMVPYDKLVKGRALIENLDFFGQIALSFLVIQTIIVVCRHDGISRGYWQ